MVVKVSVYVTYFLLCWCTAQFHMVVKAERVLLLYSDGSEELYFINNIIDSLFTCFFLRDSLKQMCRDLFLWISIGQLVIAVISWLFCLVYLYGRRVISHIFLAFFKYINGKMVLDINWIRDYVKELNGNGFKRF